MRLRLAELQVLNELASKIRTKILDKYKEFDEILHYQELLFMLKII